MKQGDKIEEITVGDHVSIPAHTRGTVWESGYVKHINRSGALIKYGATKRGGIYGSRERVPLGELVKLEVNEGMDRGATIAPPEVMPECPICKGTGWIWSLGIPGLRKRCSNCAGTGGIKR